MTAEHRASPFRVCSSARSDPYSAPMTRALTTIFLGALLAACGDPEPMAAPDAGKDAGTDAGPGSAPCARDAGALDANVAQGLTNVCTDGLVLTGLGLRWDDGSHRVARWGVFPRIPAEAFPDGCPPASSFTGANLVAELQGGPETIGTSAPGAEVLATYHVIGAGDDAPSGPLDGGAWQGIRMARGQATVELDATAEATSLVLFDLTAARMDGAPSVAVVLDGLELTTDVAQGPSYPVDYEPADGYSTRGIGAWVEGVSRDGTDLSFQVGARFALGTRDRPAMNAAVAVARTRAIVHYAVIALSAEPARGTVGYRVQSQASDDPARSVCRPDASVTELTIAGRAGLEAAPALTSFRLSLFPDLDAVGEDVRELTLRVTGFRFDAASGEASMHVEGFASNDAPPPPARGMDSRVDAEVALLQWEGPSSAELAFSSPIVVGRNELMLPMTQR